MKIRTPVILTVLSFFFLLPLKWFEMLNKSGESVPFAFHRDTVLAIVAAASLIIVFCALCSKGARIRVNTQKNALMGIVMLISSATLAFEAFAAYMSYTANRAAMLSGLTFSNITLSDYSAFLQTNHGINLPESMLVNSFVCGGSKGIVYCIACVIGAVGFLLMSYDFFGGKNFFRSKPVLAILPTIWGVARVACSYIFYTTVADLSLSIYDILFMCSTLIFLFAQARLFSDINARNSVKVATAAGLCSIIFSLCSNGIRYAMIMTDRGYFITELNTPNMSDSIITVMIAAYIIYIIAPRAHKPVEPQDIPSSTSILPPPESNGRIVSNQPHLFIHSEQDVPAETREDSQQTQNMQSANDDDYYYGDRDSRGRRIVLPVSMTARGALPVNTYRLRKASPFSPNARINTRLR